jgi:hypothetical protein
VALAALLVALAVGLVLGLVLANRGSGPSAPAQPAPIPPVAHSDDPAQQAKNLSAWLRRHSRPAPP